jgi:ornithine cyclodeaminase
VQARLQIEAAHLVKPFQRVLVWGRDGGKASRLAETLEASLGVEAQVELDGRELAASAQLLVTATPATEPIVQADWLHPGLHITAMGSDQEGKNEIDPAAVGAADLYVADRVSQCAALGELRLARRAGMLLDRDPPELGEIIAGSRSGRQSEEDITICDLTGTGAQDTAIATLARRLCAEAEQGLVIKS